MALGNGNTPMGIRSQKRRGYQYAVGLMALIIILALFTRSNVQYIHPERLASSDRKDPAYNPLPGQDEISSKANKVSVESIIELSSSPPPSPPPPPPPPPPLPKETDPRACFKNQPWIEPALDHFFKKARADLPISTLSSEESIEAMQSISWGEYHPGQDLITLKLDPSTNSYQMHTKLVHNPNQPHKRKCILPILEKAIETHGKDLVSHLKGRDLKLTIETEDFGMVFRNTGLKLPSFALCTDNDHIDIPIPDFTFGCYPEAKFTNTSWPAIANLLLHKSEMISWEHRHNSIFHRSNWGVGPRRGLMPLLEKLHNEQRDVELFGTQLDIGNTGFLASNQDQFVWLDGQCDHKFHIHTAGFSYSAALKYKLACGAVVFKFDSKYEEFYEPALKNNIHIIRLPAEEDGVNEVEFMEKTVPRIKHVVEDTLMHQGKMAKIARAGQDFVLKNLTGDALSCYWYGAIIRYADLYYNEDNNNAMNSEEEEFDGMDEEGTQGESIDGFDDITGGGDGSSGGSIDASTAHSRDEEEEKKKRRRGSGSGRKKEREESAVFPGNENDP